jgi:cell division protein FtsI (penicillin-binding protein 3)
MATTGRKKRPARNTGGTPGRPLRRTTRYTPGGIVITKWTRIRFYVVGSLITLCFFGVAYRAYGLQVLNDDHFREMAERQHLRTIEVPAPRGSIFDRNGAELAVNADVESVFVNPRAVVDLGATAEKLAEALSIDIRELEGRLASQRYFAWVKRHVTPTEAERVRALDLQGVSLTAEPRRFYPGKRLAGHILGFAGIDGKGLDGLELAMDEVLTGTQARMAALRDASGKFMVDDPSAVPSPGASITLTIDRTIQFAAERAVREAVEINKAKSAVAVVMDVTNGDVLAIASYPDFDPNSPGDAKKLGARNRAITDSYEVGSVMKVFTVASALEAGVIKPSTVIDVEKGRYRMGRKVFRDSFHDDDLDIGGIIKRSSNVGAVKIAQRLGAAALHEGFKRFGFGKRTDVELPGEVPGVIHNHKRWGELGLATHSFGYGMTSTPLQVTTAMASIGNHGVMFEPRIIREVVDGSGQSIYTRKPKGRRVLSERTADQLIPMLESVFEGGKQHGTARSLFVGGHRVGGKTGTAHKIDPATRKYGDHLYLSSFSGIAPTGDPRIAVTVLIDEPHGEEHYGGKVAGPAWTRIVSETLAVLGIPADSDLLAEQLEAKRKLERRFAWRLGLDYDKMERERRKNEVPLYREEEEDEQEESVLAMSDLDEESAVANPLDPNDAEVVMIPDFTGMSLAKVISVARKAGVAVELEGSGSAIDQSFAPGLTRRPGVVRVIFTTSEHAFADI